MENLSIDTTILFRNNPLPLAFIGDAVHTLFVRKFVLKKYGGKMNNYHTMAAKLCKASAQATALEKVMPTLSEEEADLVRRARNCKPKHSAKNATSGQYSHATAFEALIGWLYVNNNNDRLNEILSLSVTE